MKENTFLSSILICTFFIHSILFSQSGWYQQNSGTTRSLNTVFFIDENTGWVGGNSGIILKTTSGGVLWFPQNSNVPFNIICFHFIDLQVGWACVGLYTLPTFYFYGVLKTTNGGNNWVNIYAVGQMDPIIAYKATSMRFVNLLTGFMTATGTNGSTPIGFVKITTNGGYNWTNIGTSFSYMDVNFTSEPNGYLLAENQIDSLNDSAFVFKTSDVGNNWIKPFGNWKHTLYQSNFIDENTGWIAGVFRDVVENGVVLKTTNAGINWNSSFVLANTKLYSVSFGSADSGWVCGTSGKILRSIDGGINWTQQTTGINSDLNNILFVNNLSGWAVGAGGVILHTSTGGFTGINKVFSGIPVNYALSQNYPNPFNPATNIQFQIPKSGIVRLEVFDVLGNSVVLLVDEQLSTGTYEVDWDASKYSSGVYYYSLQTKNFTQTKKMILVK